MQLIFRLLLLVFVVVVAGSANAQTPTGVLTQDGVPVAQHCAKFTAVGFVGDAGYNCLDPATVALKSGLIAGRCVTVIDTFTIGSAPNPCLDPNSVALKGTFVAGNCVQASTTTTVVTVGFACLNPAAAVLRGGLVANECVVAINVGSVKGAGFPCTDPNIVAYRAEAYIDGRCVRTVGTNSTKNFATPCVNENDVTYNYGFGANGSTECIRSYGDGWGVVGYGASCANGEYAVYHDINDPNAHLNDGNCVYGYYDRYIYNNGFPCMNANIAAFRDSGTNGGNYTDGQCLAGYYAKYTYSQGYPCANPYLYRMYTWTLNFYASPNGSDTSNCDAANPCHLQRAINIAMGNDSGNNDIYINLAGGTYNGSYVSGGQTIYSNYNIKGPLHGISGGNIRYLTLTGLGSGTTVVDPGSAGGGYCVNGFNLDMGALAVFQNMTIQNTYAYNTDCGGAALTILTASTAMYSADFQIGPASWAGIMLFDRSTFKCKGDLHGLKMYGGSRLYGIVGSTGSAVILCGGGPNGSGAGHIVRSGNYPTFIDLIDASSFNPGLHSLFYQNEQGNGGPCTDVTFVCATGAKFFAVVNSWLDMEAIHLVNLPGNLIAHVGVGSSILNNDGNLGACTYGQATAFGMCPAQNQNWGIGDNGSIRVLQPGEIGGGASGWGGRLEMSWGNANVVEVGGYAYVYLPYALQGPTNNGGICIAGLGLQSDGNNFWPNYSTVRALYSNGTPYLLIKWNAPGLAAVGQAVQKTYIDYLCH